MDIITGEVDLISIVGKELSGDNIVDKVREDAGVIGGINAIYETDVDHGRLDRVYKTFAPSIVTAMKSYILIGGECAKGPVVATAWD